jgi:hypothetical protein
MNNQHYLLCLLSGILFTFTSCQSEDPVSGGDSDGTTPTKGGAVQFTYNTSSVNVKSYYDTDGSVKWSHDDHVRIVSPVSGQSDASHQHALYTIGGGGGGGEGDFTHVLDAVYTVPVYWNEGSDRQDFYGYYPATSVGVSPTSNTGAITDIDPVTGTATYHVPYDQSLTANIIPSSSDDQPNPLAYAIAATRRVSVNEQAPVDMEFYDFMNVLRIHIHNPYGREICGVSVSSSNSTPCAGSITVSANNYDGTANNDNLEFGVPSGRAFIAAETDYNSYDPRPGGVQATTDADVYYDLYMLPQDYAAGTVKVTVYYDYWHFSNAKSDTKTIPSSFAQSSTKRVRIDLKPEVDFTGAMDLSQGGGKSADEELQ